MVTVLQEPPAYAKQVIDREETVHRQRRRQTGYSGSQGLCVCSRESENGQLRDDEGISSGLKA